jgi:uncharacterized iron-regulated membrane protein
VTRALWLQVHKWIGLLLAALIVPVSLSGAMLVWHEELEHVLHPERFAATGRATLSADAYVAAARAAVGQEARIASLTLPGRDGGAVVVGATAAPGGEGRPVRTSVHLDPGSARVLDVARSDQGLLRFLHVLHGSLYLPGVGRQVVGWIGVAMMLSAFTGLWLWWPASGRWTRGLRWARRRELDANLHHRLGFWIALPLFVLSLTGAWISFPVLFGRLSGEARPAGGGRAPPLATTRLTVADALAAAPAETVRSVAWPTEKKRSWTLRLADGQLAVNDVTGLVVREPAPTGGVARLMRRVHDGTGTPLLWRVVIFLGGLLPAVLAVTGIAMWWRARGWRGRVRAGTRRVAAA